MDIYKKILSVCSDLQIKVTKFLIFVDIAKQKLYFLEGNKILDIFSVSTSRNPPSCIEGSNGTPLGLHKIDGKIGEGLPLNTVFKGRQSVGLLSEQSDADKNTNLILGRIMRLRGLEEGKNSGGNLDSFNRYVYIHGTNQEDKIGTPNSHGCILLDAKSLKKLFDNCPDQTLVLIEP